MLLGEYKKGFTLVELVIVISLLAILSTIAFISVQSYSRDSRNTKRAAESKQALGLLDMFMIKTSQYPTPDDAQIVDYAGETVYTQGLMGTGVMSNLGIAEGERPIDPVSGDPYIYSTTMGGTQYELLVAYEGPMISPHIFPVSPLSLSFAPKVQGSYNGLSVTTPNYIIPTPSIITAGELPFTLSSTTLRSQVYTGLFNIPQSSLYQAYTGSLNIPFSIYNGVITKQSSDAEKIAAVSLLQSVYGGTAVEEKHPYSYLLNQTSSEDKLQFADIHFLRFEKDSF